MTVSGRNLRLADAVDRRVQRINQALGAHAGGLVLDGVSERGEVNVRFTGMCTGCPLKPITMAALIRPALAALEGVIAVAAPGSAISSEAQESLGALLAAYGSTRLVDRLKS